MLALLIIIALMSGYLPLFLKLLVVVVAALL
jgi:hypothetical protein